MQSETKEQTWSFDAIDAHSSYQSIKDIYWIVQQHGKDTSRVSTRGWIKWMVTWLSRSPSELAPRNDPESVDPVIRSPVLKIMNRKSYFTRRFIPLPSNVLFLSGRSHQFVQNCSADSC
jgi:hypothetical protein